MTAVIGKNGVGKSTLFDAFGFLQEKELPDQFPFDVLFSTLVGPKDINLIFEINSLLIKNKWLKKIRSF